MAATFTLVVVVGLALLLAGEYSEQAGLKLFGKPLASTGFLGVAWSLGALDDPYGRAIFVALVLCWTGDVCLLSRAKPAFLAGLGSFLLGHAGFCVAFVRLEPSWLIAVPVAALLAAPAWFVGHRWLGPHLPDDMRGPVWAYIAVITSMLALAVAAVASGAPWLVLLGALAFYLSDLSVARDRFIEEGFVNGVWGLPMYYAGVTLLAWSVSAV